MSTDSTSRQDKYHDYQLGEIVLKCTNHTVDSQKIMLDRIEESIQASSTGIEALLRQILESQIQNQQQMTEMLKILANNNSIDTGVSNNAARKSSVVSPNKNDTSIQTHHEDNLEEADEIVRNEASGSNQQQDDQQTNLSGYEWFEPLNEAVEEKDWKKVTEYLSVVANQTNLKETFETRDCGEEINTFLIMLLVYDQMMLLEEFLNLVPPEALEYVNPKSDTILHLVALKGNLRAAKALVKKNRNLTQIRNCNCDVPIVPLLSAIITNVSDGQNEMVEYLCSVTRDEDPSPFSGQQGDLLMNCLDEHKNDISEEVYKLVENKVSESNQQQGYEGYEPLSEALEQKDWKKAMEYVAANQTTLETIFQTRDCGEEILMIVDGLILFDQMMLLEEFLKAVPPEALEFRKPDTDGITILHRAAEEGKLWAVKALVKKNRNLTQMRTSCGSMVPLVTAVLGCVTDAQKEVVEFLVSETRDEDPSPFSGKDGAMLFATLFTANMYGVAISIFQRFPETLKQWIADSEVSRIVGLLKFLIERPFTFRSGIKLTWWERRIYSILEEDRESEHDGCIDKNEQKVLESEGSKGDEENLLGNSTNEKSSSSTRNKRTISKCIWFYFTRCVRRVPCINKLYHQKLMHIQAVELVKCLLQVLHDTKDEEIIEDIFLKNDTLEMAVKFRTTEFILECFRSFPFLGLNKALLKLVVRERNELIYSFMCILRRKENYEAFSTQDENLDSILHVAAEVAHNRQLNIVSGAAFQMQREIQWFKGVENTVIEKYRFTRNKKGESPQFLFTEKHKDLMEKSEKWMKELSTSCMVVAALIATIAFAAAITVPGGNISDSDSGENGLPIFLHDKSFMLFAIPNALALFSSVTSVLMFLTVFTSRYSEEDFIKSLPQKIIIGLFTLFISMATMLVAFGAVFTIVVGRGSVWATIIVSLLGCAPLLLFGFMQFPLFFEMVRSTYWPITFGNEDNPLLKPYLPKEKKD